MYLLEFDYFHDNFQNGYDPLALNIVLHTFNNLSSEGDYFKFTPFGPSSNNNFEFVMHDYDLLTQVKNIIIHEMFNECNPEFYSLDIIKKED